MQKKSIKHIFTSLILVIALAMSFLIIGEIFDNKNLNDTIADAETVDVSTFSELKEQVEQGAKKIRITSDMEATETIYIDSVTEIFSNDSYTITRNVDFLGDMFVVGTDKDGSISSVKNGRVASLTMQASDDATLTIDGNMTNMEDKIIVGTAFMIVNSAEFNMKSGVVVQNHKKLGNQSTSAYRVSYPTKIGGSAVIVTSGTFNMFGGIIDNCQTNTVEDDEAISTQGGAIYNFGQFNMYGGKITNCKSARGAVLYNYKIAKIYSGEISKNYATVYGGAIYLPNSQYSNLVVGDYVTENKVTFSENSTDGSGGAIFSSIYASIFIPGATKFVGNTAGSNGGAINSPGANIIRNTTFESNTAGSKGGAMYVYHNKVGATIRYTILENVNFIKNTSTAGGGGIGVGSSSADGEYDGAKAFIKSCTFEENNAKQGGAVYAHRKAYIEMDSCEVKKNKTTDSGGALYITGTSTIKINKSNFTNNEAKKYGGGAYILGSSNANLNECDFTYNTATSYGGGIEFSGSSTASLNKCNISNNSSSNNGGGLYLGGCEVTCIDCVLSNNTSTALGGGIYITGPSTIIFNNITANNNTAQKGGFLYLTKTNSVVKITGGEALGNTATEEAGGSTIWTNIAKVTLQIKGTTTKEYFNYDGKILGNGTVTEYEE